MDEEYREYIIKRIESAVNDYTTMSREDLGEYVLTWIERLIEEYEDDRESE